MAFFYVRSASDGSTAHLPFPGTRYDAADGDAAILAYLVQFPSTPENTILIATPESALICRKKQTTPVPAPLPTYT